MTLTRDDAENSEDYCEGSDVEIATTAAVSFSVDVYDNNDDGYDDGDDDGDDDGGVKRWDDDDGVGGCADSWELLGLLPTLLEQLPEI